MDKLKLIEQEYLKQDIPEFQVGDTVKVYTRIKEGDKTRLHPFQGIVIARRGSGIREVFTVRKVTAGEGIERVFPLHAPVIEKIEIIRLGKVRRAKIYYMRSRIGKSAIKVKSREPRASAQETAGKKGKSR
ncbi:MAG: 50S ribosomal protein L19 [Candidatus Omnitrophica bacterium]|nr:50S ribosomal protein L19 [Candidatus Omnitrophota bacterium]